MKDFVSQFIGDLRPLGFAPKRASDVKPCSEALIQNERGKTALYYSLTIEGNFAYGRFYDCSTGESAPWHSKAGKNLSETEKAELKKARDALIKTEKEARDAEHKRVRDALLPVIKALPFAESHPYLERKRVKAWRVRLDKDNAVTPLINENKKWKSLWEGEKLIIPLVNVRGDLQSAQAITEDGEKAYIMGADKKGCFFPIGWRPGKDQPETIIICEGYATGCSIHEATELPVACAMDTAGVKSVAAPLKQAHETARLIFAADNDQWTFKWPLPKELREIDRDDFPYDAPEWAQWQKAGYLNNPGLEAAQEAAYKTGGRVCVPVFKALTGKSTDFNDLSCAEGPETVRLLFEALNAPVQQDAPPTMEEAGDIRGLPFRVLGHRDRVFYYYSFLMGNVVALTSNAHNYTSFLELARDKEWRDAYAHGGEFRKNHITEAMDEMMTLARKKGVYDDSAGVRGVGAWVDGKRLIIHTGPVVYVDGTPTEPHNVVSAKHVYVKGPKIFDIGDRPLNSEERDAFIRICAMPTWENPVNAIILRGFIVTALFGTALKWRPNIWIWGDHGSGKSTIARDIVMGALGDMGLKVALGSTESGIRQTLGSSGRPLIYDEAEGKSIAQKQTMMNVVALARLASDGQNVIKFGQRSFKAQFSVCFASTTPVISEKADESRIMRLKVNVDKSLNARQHFQTLTGEIKRLIDRNFAPRLISLVSQNFTALQKNIEIFNAAAQKGSNNPRAADQIGAVMAGAYLFESDGVVNEDYAEQWVSQYDWVGYTTIGEESDVDSFVSYILQAVVRIQHPVKGSMDMSIGELLLAAAGRGDIGHKDAARFLLHYGIKYDNNEITIANRNQHLARLLRDKPEWATGDGGWSNLLASYPGAKRTSSAVYLGPGTLKQRAIVIPAAVLFETTTQQNLNYQQDDTDAEEVAF